jgi:hypothetical protein
MVELPCYRVSMKFLPITPGLRLHVNHVQLSKWIDVSDLERIAIFKQLVQSTLTFRWGHTGSATPILVASRHVNPAIIIKANITTFSRGRSEKGLWPALSLFSAPPAPLEHLCFGPAHCAVPPPPSYISC